MFLKLGGGEEQEQTSQKGWSIMVANDNIYCFLVDFLTRPSL